MKGQTPSMWSLLVVIMLSLMLAACQAAPPQATPLTVGNEYMEAVVRGDADAMVATISDDMVMVVDGGPFFFNEITGEQALKEYMQGNTSTGFKLELTGDAAVNGNQVTYPNRFAMDVFRQVGVEWVNGADVVTIENGKVSRDVWTIDPASIQELAAAFAALQGLSADKLAGVWRWDGGQGIGVTESHYREDGTYELIRYDVTGHEVIWDVGVYAIEGDKVTLTTTEAHYCRVGDQGAYQMAITEDGRLENTPLEDACGRRKPPVEGAMYLELVTP